ncbi:Zinc carboxypeptidase A 1 [Metarhizium anisopliae]|nr:Zinc carboxypeptidase A 1 [Metarhizium anisopliae]
MKLQTALSLAALGYVTTGCLLPEELEGGKISLRRRQSARTKKYAPIGKGDRFEGGNKVPYGIGSDPDNFKDVSKLSILSVSEIESALKGLEQEYPEKINLSKADDKTFEGRDIYYGVVGSNQPRVFLTSGVHARERGGPDNIIYLISDLLWADKQNANLTYDGKTYDASEVRQALEVGIAIIPAVNPDGINFDQTHDACWRKNRRPFGNEFGVDINRNFRVFWDYERIFHPQASVSMSNMPSDETYVGPSPLSEPETRSITNVFKRVTSLSWYLDLHSALGKVLYSWGDDYAQFSDPSMSFRNQRYDRQRGLFHDEYKEYMEQDDFDAQKSAAERMATAMNSVAGSSARYKADQTINLYPALGSTDEAMAGYYNQTCGASRIHALTFEFGQRSRSWDCNDIFYPDARQYRDNIVHTNVGLMELLLTAAGKDGESKTYKCDNGQGTSEEPKPEQQRPNNPQAQLTPEQRECLAKSLPEYNACRDQACRDSIAQKIRDCAEEATNAKSQPKPESPKPEEQTPKSPAAQLTREQQECLAKSLPEYNACEPRDQACRDNIAQRIRDCAEQATKAKNSPKPEKQGPQNQQAQLSPEQRECLAKSLPEYNACEPRDQACRDNIAQRIRDCADQAMNAKSAGQGQECPPGSSYSAFFGGCAS